MPSLFLSDIDNYCTSSWIVPDAATGLEKRLEASITRKRYPMIQFLKISILAGVLMLAIQTSAQADPPPQRCDTRWTQEFIGRFLTLAVKEQVRKQARATTAVVNSLDRQHQNNRLRIQTDPDLKITHLACG
uniref:hypothetical protein n=1 Tax=Pseudomonas sp. Z003-0.4C(8344-21) TaxID=1855380 RepID=UPI0012FD8A59|nr:hypothetical protein [Pseudomonas sp. Z003-0.4C(8344-21)]